MKVIFEDKKIFSSKVRPIFISELYFDQKLSLSLVSGFKKKQVFLPRAWGTFSSILSGEGWEQLVSSYFRTTEISQIGRRTQFRDVGADSEVAL